MGLGVIVIANDFTALNVALPAIEEDFDVDVGTIQWASTPTRSSSAWAIVTGGRLADMLGRRKIFFIGTRDLRRLLAARRRSRRTRRC